MRAAAVGRVGGLHAFEIGAGQGFYLGEKSLQGGGVSGQLPRAGVGLGSGGFAAAAEGGGLAREGVFFVQLQLG